MKNQTQLEERLKTIISMWKDHTLQEIGEELGITRQAVSQLVYRLRQNGLDIPPKRISKFNWKKFVKDNKNKLSK